MSGHENVRTFNVRTCPDMKMSGHGKSRLHPDESLDIEYCLVSFYRLPFMPKFSFLMKCPDIYLAYATQLFHTVCSCLYIPLWLVLLDFVFSYTTMQGHYVRTLHKCPDINGSGHVRTLMGPDMSGH